MTVLRTPDSQDFPVHEWDTDLDTSKAVYRLLLEGHAWVQILDDEGDLLMSWHVLERDDNGMPVQIGSEEAFGEEHAEILSNYPELYLRYAGFFEADWKFPG